MGNNRIQTILLAILFGAGVYFTIRYLWPLLLVIALGIGIGIWSLKREAKKAEDDFRRTEEEFTRERTYQDDLFQESVEQVKRREEGEVIDVEFTRKEPEEEKQQQL
ncbi:MAG: hypothetical protein IJ225_01850 [Solobacterium sp.]|nr:hypothetical protein [Solobacterium sp.]